jgi:hypothetical protein
MSDGLPGVYQAFQFLFRRHLTHAGMNVSKKPTELDSGIRRGLVLLGFILIGIGVLIFILPASEEVKNLAAGSSIGAGVTLLTTEYISLSERRQRKSEHDELIKQNTDLKRELATLHSLVAPLNVEASNKREVRLVEEVNTFFMGCFLSIAAGGTPQALQLLFPSHGSSMSPMSEMHDNQKFLGMEFDDKIEEEIDRVTDHWFKGADLSVESFNAVYEAIDKALPLGRRDLFRHGVNFGRLAQSLVEPRRDPEEEPDRHLLFRPSPVFMAKQIVRDDGGVLGKRGVPDTMVLPWVLKKILPLLERLIECAKPEEPSSEDMANFEQTTNEIKSLLPSIVASLENHNLE